MSKSILVIAPHADDEILSYGGYLIDRIAQGDRVHIVIATIGGLHKLQDYDTRVSEFNNVMKELNPMSYEHLYPNHDTLLDRIPLNQIATDIEKRFDELHPDEVFCNYPSTHQDHVHLHKAFSIATRLRSGYLVPTVAYGEYPFILTSMTLPDGGKWYHPLSEEVLQKKLDLFNLYKTQVRPSPSPLGEEGIKLLARTRGFECGHQYAELFYLQKMVK